MSEDIQILEVIRLHIVWERDTARLSLVIPIVRSATVLGTHIADSAIPVASNS